MVFRRVSYFTPRSRANFSRSRSCLASSGVWRGSPNENCGEATIRITWYSIDAPEVPVPEIRVGLAVSARASVRVFQGNKCTYIEPSRMQNLPSDPGATHIRGLHIKEEARRRESRKQISSSNQQVVDSNATDEQQQMKQQQQQPHQHPKKLLHQQQVPIGVPPPAEFLMPCTQLELGHSMGGDTLWQGRTAYPYPDPYFGSMVAAYGAQAMIHPHVLGVQQAGLPLPSDTIEEPVYVNAKQYHGILRRRQSRAKAESENKLIKSRKPYLHESRHLHALKRARGCGGRFLNTKKDGSLQDGMPVDKNLQDCMGQYPRADEHDSVKACTSQESTDAKRIEKTGNITKLESDDGTGHSGMIPAAASKGIYHSYRQIRPLHSSAFHLLSVGSAESGQAGGMVSNGGHHTAVATQ